MDCSEARAYLTEYIDGFLIDKERAQLEAHFEACAACKKEVEAQRALRSALRALKVEDTSDFVFDIEKAKAPVVLPLYKRRWVRSLSVAAACIVLFVGVLAVTQNGYQTPQNSEGQRLESEAADARITEEENGKIEITNGSRARMAEVPYADTDLTVPDSFNYYSSKAPETVEEKQTSTSVVSEPAAAEAELGAAVQAESEAAVPPVLMTDKTDDASISPVQAPASGGASANPMPNCSKRTVRLSVSAEAQAEFAQALSALQIAGFDGETVIAVSDLEQLLSIEGVLLVSDSSSETQSADYQGKVALLY